MADDTNVLGGRLDPCSVEPRTGFFRDGCCNTGPDDLGLHVVCARMTAKFLAFSAERGNDLSTPQPRVIDHVVIGDAPEALTISQYV